MSTHLLVLLGEITAARSPFHWQLSAIDVSHPVSIQTIPTHAFLVPASSSSLSFHRRSYCPARRSFSIDDDDAQLTLPLQIHLEQILDDCSRGTFLSSKQRIHGHLEALMVHATKHPWMTWITVRVKDRSVHKFFSLCSSHCQINPFQPRFAPSNLRMRIRMNRPSLHLVATTDAFDPSDVLRLVDEYLRLQWSR